MWLVDSITGEIVIDDQFTYAVDPAYDYCLEDEDPFWSSEDDDDSWYESMAEDAAMEGHLFGWDA